MTKFMPRFTLATDYAIAISDFRTPPSTRQWKAQSRSPQTPNLPLQMLTSLSSSNSGIEGQGHSGRSGSGRREIGEWPGCQSVARFVGNVFHSTLHLMFRFGAEILAGNIGAAGILSWSATEAQRFPTTNTEKAPEIIFPILGMCSQGAFFLLFDAGIFTAGIGTPCETIGTYGG